MTTKRWQSLIDQLDDAGQIDSKNVEDIIGRPGTVERVIVKTLLGRFRLSWTSEPKRLSEKALYSKRGGSTAAVQVKYDESETIHVFTVERMSGATGSWEAVDIGSFTSL